MRETITPKRCNRVICRTWHRPEIYVIGIDGSGEIWLWYCEICQHVEDAIGIPEGSTATL